MIIISAGAGLGNQMFEYAFYMKICKTYPGTEVCLDPDYAFPRAHNGYEVERIFGLKSNRAAKEDIYAIADPAYLLACEESHSLVSKVKRKFGLRKASFLPQKDFSEYYEDYFKLDKDRSWYLYGPFANSRYFADIKEEVLEKYQFPELDESNMELADEIGRSESVSVHVRRGDYLEQGIDLLGKEYYGKAMSIIEEKTGRSRDGLEYYVFSDDHVMAAELFGDKKNVHYVTHNKGDQGYRDMQLMSLCKHNIIANSSFSFWGGYLNRNEDKIVVSSAKPFRGCRNPFSCEDWISI